jgi:peptide methionine sulfoxide reductase msrA/msrB
MTRKKEIFIFPVLFVAAVWLTDTFWPNNQPHRIIEEENKSMKKKVEKTDEEWKKILTNEQFRVMRKAGTERPFSGKYNDHYEKGVYSCAGCGTPLFLSDAKYNHGTGWPSFTEPLDEKSLEYREDLSLSMKRIEVRCASCGAHLGHVFGDGPPPSQRHFCINSVALDFSSNPPIKDENTSETTQNLQIATFAAGCFWGVEDKFSKIPGVVRTTVGYTGGTAKDPSYEQVCQGNTGHAEAVHIVYDPAIVSYRELLDAFFRFHDPTQLNRQGPDIGSQYRSAIFYHNEVQRQEAENMIDKLAKSGQYDAPIATQIRHASEFYQAEEYHQKYYEKLLKKKK